MKNKPFPNRLASIASIGLIWMASTGFAAAPAGPQTAQDGTEFIPVVLRASNAADYGAEAAQVVIAPVDINVIASTLTDRGADVEQAQEVLDAVEQQIEELPSQGPQGQGGQNGSNSQAPVQLQTSNVEAAGSSVDDTPTADNGPENTGVNGAWVSNAELIPGLGYAFGYNNGNALGHSNENNGQGSLNASANGLANGVGHAVDSVTGNNGQGPSSNNGQGNANGQSNGVGVGLEINAGDDEIEVEIDVNPGKALGLDKQEDKQDNSNKDNNGNSGNGNNGNGNGNNN